MRKRFTIELVAVVLAGWCCAAPLPRAAVLMADDPGSMANETDLLDGFGAIDKYHIRELEQLNRKLPQYDIVVFTSCANYEADRDFNDFRDAWQKYVAGGGTVLVFDANYPQTSDRVTAPFLERPEPFVWEACQVSGESYSDGGIAAGGEVRWGEPASLTGYLPKLRSWQHFDRVPAGWEPVIECKHGRPMLLERRYGKGSVLVSNYYGLYSIVGKEFIRDLVRNLVFQRSWEREGLELTANEVVFDDAGLRWQGTVHADAAAVPGLTARLLDAAGLELAQAPLAFDAEGYASYRFDVVPPEAGATTVIEREHAEFPAYRRFHAAPDRRVRWHLPARLQPGQLARVRIPLANTGNRSCADAGIRVDDTLYFATVAEDGVLRGDLSGIAPGTHRVSLVLDGEETETQTFTVTAPEMYLTIDADGWLSRGGEDFFPIALYHVSRATGVTAENRMKCLAFAADNGYNLILMSTIGESADDAFMAEAARRGVAIFCDVKAMEEIAAKRDQWPAVASWMHELDEPEHWGYSRDDVLRRAEAIYRADPRSVIFSSMETASTIVAYSGVADLMATTGYPVPHDPLRLVFDKMKLLTAMAEKYMFVPIATVQAFGYPRPEDRGHGYPGLPTPQQIRNMTWQALLNNVRGIQYYTYADGAFLLDDYPELYECMRRLPAEIAPAIPFLRGGDFTRLETGDSDIEGGCWRLSGRSLTVYVNLSDTPRRLSADDSIMSPYEVIIRNQENQ